MSTSLPEQPDLDAVTPICSIFRRFLRRRQLKFTAERAEILNAVLATDGVFEVDQLMYDMRQAGVRISKATIYRAIKHLVEAGIVREVLLDTKQSHYQLAYGTPQTDHLVCVDDETMIEFASEELLALRDAICRKHGMQAIGHRFLIYATKLSKASEPDPS